MIELDEKSYVVALWSCEIKKSPAAPMGGDFMALLWKKEQSAPFQLDFRFRYVKDELVWGSSDEKRWGHAKLGPNSTKTDAEIEDACDLVVAGFAKIAGVKPVKIGVHGGVEEFIKAKEGVPYMHSRTVDEKDST